MQRRSVLLALATAGWWTRAAPAQAQAQNFAADARVSTYIDYLQKEHAFSPAELRAFFGRITYDRKVLRLAGVGADKTDKPAKKTYWRQYRKQRLTPKKIATGIAFHKQHASALARAEAAYGVPAAIIIGILGIETHYGRHTGTYGVAQTLATLGFGHPQRGEEFLQELTEFLLYARESRVDPLSISGSYAGAIGMAQFMPSSLRRFAVDSDGDARVNLFTAEDAIASIGNFLHMHGWQPGEGITYPATVEALQAKKLITATASNAYRAVMTSEELRNYGVHTTAPEGAHYVFVDLENRYDTEYRVGTRNFYALTRYNKSFKYAAVVTDLATEIASGV